MRTEHGSLTVSTGDDAAVFDDVGDDMVEVVEYEVHLVWADKQIGFFADDPESLRNIGGKDGKLDKGEREFLDELADRIEDIL